MKSSGKMLTVIYATAAMLSANAYASNNTPLQAENPTNKYYIELNGGTNAWYLGIVSSKDSLTNGGVNGYGWQAAFGYNFNPTTAIEVGFMQNYVIIKEVDRNETCDFSGCTMYVTNREKTYNSNVPTIAVKFTVPMGKRFDFISKLGLMMPLVTTDTSYEDSSNKSTQTDGVVLPYISLGFDYNVTQNIRVNIQYQGAIYVIAGAGLLSAGLSYSFS